MDEAGRATESWFEKGLKALSAASTADSRSELTAAFEEAVHAFSEVILRVPDHVPAWLHRGHALRRLDRHLEAVLAYREVVRHQPDNDVGWQRLAEELAEVGRPAEAEAALDEFLRVPAGDAEAHLAKGNVLARRGRSDGARAAYAEALRLGGEGMHDDSQTGLFDALRHFEEARAAYAEVMLRAPGDRAAWIRAGGAFHRAGRRDDALRAFETALRLGPDEHAWLGLARVLIRADRLGEAVSAGEEALRLRPGWKDALTVLDLARKLLVPAVPPGPPGRPDAKAPTAVVPTPVEAPTSPSESEPSPTAVARWQRKLTARRQRAKGEGVELPPAMPSFVRSPPAWPVVIKEIKSSELDEAGFFPNVVTVHNTTGRHLTVESRPALAFQAGVQFLPPWQPHNRDEHGHAGTVERGEQVVVVSPTDWGFRVHLVQLRYQLEGRPPVVATYDLTVWPGEGAGFRPGTIPPNFAGELLLLPLVLSTRGGAELVCLNNTPEAFEVTGYLPARTPTSAILEPREMVSIGSIPSRERPEAVKVRCAHITGKSRFYAPYQNLERTKGRAWGSEVDLTFPLFPDHGEVLVPGAEAARLLLPEGFRPDA